MFAPITLEILVLVLGFALLLAESFSNAPSKRALPKIALFVLAWVFAFSFFTSPAPDTMEPGSFWNFYSASPISMMFKRIALLRDSQAGGAAQGV